MICAPAAERPAVRMGDMGRNSRERREDGADDHPHEPANRESVLGEPAAEAQSPAAQPHQDLSKAQALCSKAGSPTARFLIEQCV